MNNKTTKTTPTTKTTIITNKYPLLSTPTNKIKHKTNNSENNQQKPTKNKKSH